MNVVTDNVVVVVVFGDGVVVLECAYSLVGDSGSPRIEIRVVK